MILVKVIIDGNNLCLAYWAKVCNIKKLLKIKIGAPSAISKIGGHRNHLIYPIVRLLLTKELMKRAGVNSVPKFQGEACGDVVESYYANLRTTTGGMQESFSWR